VGWDGAPAWATSLVGTVATCRLAERELSVAVQASFSAFFLDLGGVQAHLVSTWAAVADRFAADPAIAGYDLLNEPNPGLVPGVDDYALLGAFYDRALTAIRAAETAGGGFDHIGFFEPAVITGPLATPGPLPGLVDDANLVYAPHLYNESISLLPGTIEDGFGSAATAAASYGTPFFSGEWGWFGDSAADQPLLERYAAAEDAHLVGGTWWQWRQACGDPHAVPGRHQRPSCAGRSPFSDGLVVRSPANLAVLTRAYPRAAPGRLTSVQADVPSGAITVTGTADRAGTSADLWVPARCAAPAVMGTGIGTGAVRAVDGGWRIEVPVTAIGAYRIQVTCRAATVTSTTVEPAGHELPITGAELEGRALLASILLALAACSRRALQR
jgi:endoglycosylceramidase